MDVAEQQIIDELFGRLHQVERQSGPREPEAEAYIRGLMNRQPGAPYYMAQVIIMQEQALLAAQAKLDELERQLEEQPTAGFLGGIFGEPLDRRAPDRVPAATVDPRLIPYFQSGTGKYGGSGFLAGALQTALGVSGGVMLANALTEAFGIGEAEAAQSIDPSDSGVGSFDTGLDDF